jgi:hypothetical protein
MPESGLRRRLLVIGIGLLVIVAAAVAVGTPPALDPTARSSAALETAADRPPGPGTGGPGAAGSPGSRGDAGPAVGANGVPDDPAHALAAALRARAAAVAAGDRAAWLAAVDPRSGRFRRDQGTVFDRIRSLHPVRWTYGVDGGSPLAEDRRSALGGTGWRADVTLTYQLEAATPVVRRQQVLTVVRRGERWLIAGDTDGQTGRDVWDLGPIVRASSSRCLVIGARARRAQVRRLAAECPDAAATVDRAWGSTWSRRVEVVVPGSLSQLAALLGRSGSRGGTGTAGLEQTAAITVGPADRRSEEVLVNGTAFEELNPLGRQVVLTHELVHVATRDTGSRDAPIWLAEGYADYVAYGDTGLPAEQIAGEALAAVRAGELPDALPGTDEFDTAGDKAAQAYGQAWVAVGAIARRVKGPAGLKTFYQRASAPGAGSAGLDAALAGARLRDRDALVKIWQARLIDLAT